VCLRGARVGESTSGGFRAFLPSRLEFRDGFGDGFCGFLRFFAVWGFNLRLELGGLGGRRIRYKLQFGFSLTQFVFRLVLVSRRGNEK
jgi:hypothetical protein